MTLRPLLTALFAACVGATALAQSAVDRSTLSSTAPLTEAQKSAIESFASKHIDTIKDGNDAKKVEEARMALLTPARDPAASPTFRKTYAIMLIGELGATVKGRDVRRAINAMQVLRFTRTPEGLDAIIERAMPSAETEPSKRIAAAGLASDAFEDLDAVNAYFETAARRLKEAAVAESDPIAMQQKFAAISSAARRRDLPPENARAVRRQLVDGIAAIAKSIRGSSKADSRVMALQRALIGVRNDLLEMSGAERTAVSKVLAPALADLIAAAGAQWASAHDQPALSQSYGSLLNSCEVLLRLIDRSERAAAYSGSKSEGDARILTPAWESKDKAKFDAESKKWSDIVGAAPYR
ncbi:MAG: hypothetical protein RIT24_2798 [Planctomycetota bacterium]|jgi:hypothetical protein